MEYMDEGWIKIKRKLRKSPLWKDCNAAQKVVMITVLLMANHKPNRWMFNGEEYEVKAGEFITSLNSLVKETGCSKQQVRTALSKLEKYTFIRTKKTYKNTLITIVNWPKYQGVENFVNKNVDNLWKTEKGEKLTQGVTQTSTQGITQHKSFKTIENKKVELSTKSGGTQEITHRLNLTQHRPNTDLTPNKNDKNINNINNKYIRETRARKFRHFDFKFWNRTKFTDEVIDSANRWLDMVKEMEFEVDKVSFYVLCLRVKEQATTSTEQKELFEDWIKTRNLGEDLKEDEEINYE